MLVKTSIHALYRPLESGIETSHAFRQRNMLNASLSSLLANVYGLYQQCLYYYWSVAGDEHLGLDELFEQQYEALQKLGSHLEEHLHDIQMTAKPVDIYPPSFPDNRKAVTSVRDMLTNVVKGHEACSQKALEALELAEEQEDQKTVSLLLQAMLQHDKSIWMIKALCS